MPEDEEALAGPAGLVLTGEEAALEAIETLRLSPRSWALLWGSAVAVLGLLLAAAYFAAS